MRKTHAGIKMANIPPLNSLKAFEASARYGSFTIAADELSVTQGAISKQIKILEEYLGLAMFERRHQHIVLTKEAEIYIASIRSAFETIEQATAQLMDSDTSVETLCVNALPSLSSRWLVPLLDDFKTRFPHVSLNIEVGNDDVDMDTCTADVAIRVSKVQRWENLYSHKIMDEDLIPVCSPKLKLKSPNDLPKYALLQHTSRPNMWHEYLKAIGYEHFKVEHKVGLEHFFMLIEAAIDGVGVVLVPRFLVKNELKNGQLILAFDCVYNSPFSYYLLCKKNKKNLTKVKIFKDWLYTASEIL